VAGLASLGTATKCEYRLGLGDDTELPIVDLDMDCIPDAAERFVLGFNPYHESTDNDRYDDGQEFWGITQIGRGSLPRAVDSDFLLAEMPNFVDPPGRSPLCTAYPEIRVRVITNSIRIQTRQTIRTENREIHEDIFEYETEQRSENHTSRSNLTPFNEVARELQNGVQPATTEMQQLVRLGAGAAEAASLPEAGLKAFLSVETPGSSECDQTLRIQLAEDIRNLEARLDDNVEILKEYTKVEEQIDYDTTQVFDLASGALSLGAGASAGTKRKGTELGLNAGLSLDVGKFVGLIANELTGFSDKVGGLKGTIASLQIENENLHRKLDRLYQTRASLANCQTRSRGPAIPPAPPRISIESVQESSSQSVRTRQFQRVMNRTEWAKATTVDTHYAGDLRFDLEIANDGTDVARSLNSILINVLLGDGETVVQSVDILAQQQGIGAIRNLFPGAHFRINAPVQIQLSLEQMKQIDLGGAIRIQIVRIEYGDDQLFYENAYAGGVLFMVDNGVDDQREDLQPYLLPTWGTETSLQVLQRVTDVLKLNLDEANNVRSVDVPVFDAQHRISHFERLANKDNARWLIFSQTSDSATFSNVASVRKWRCNFHVPWAHHRASG